DELGRADALITGLVDEALPDTTSVLLENWERIAGLPNECSALAETESDRRANLLAKLRARGGQSVAYIVDVVDAMGYEITIDEYTPFIVDESYAGDPLYDDDWYFVFKITAPDVLPDHTGFECLI